MIEIGGRGSIGSVMFLVLLKEGMIDPVGKIFAKDGKQNYQWDVDGYCIIFQMLGKEE